MKRIEVNNQCKSVLGQLSQLEVGAQLTLPVCRASYIRAICSSFGLQWSKKFSVRTDRGSGTITATRIS